MATVTNHKWPEQGWAEAAAGDAGEVGDGPSTSRCCLQSPQRGIDCAALEQYGLCDALHWCCRSGAFAEHRDFTLFFKNYFSRVWKMLIGFCFCLYRLRKVIMMFLVSLIYAKYVSPTCLCFLFCAFSQPLLQLSAGRGVFLAAHVLTWCYPAGEK